jgi:CheY-like chemotaxis protein
MQSKAMHKLLLADDSVTIQRVIELTFADEDVQVLTVGDGEQAISRIQDERPDIVLADIGMPKRSGYDVAAFVKSQPEFSHIPVLLLTGAFEPVDERRAQAAGCDGVLVKPFEPQHVIARVRELLRGHSDGRAARPSGGVTRAVADVPRPAERLAPPRVDVPLRPASRANSSTPDTTPLNESLDDYFDRLDAAFANISSGEVQPVRRPEAMPRNEGPVMEKDLDWFDATMESAMGQRPEPVQPTPSPPVEPTPATFATPPTSVEWPPPPPASIEPPEAPAQMATYSRPHSPVPTSNAPMMPVTYESTGAAIADAFSALLAVEQGEPGAVPVRLAVTAGAPVVSEEVIEEITRRVVERLAPDTMRDVVADVVAEVAEKLIREEIERIRNEQS